MTGADLELAVSGRVLRFPAVWLRDNCPCPECVAPGTSQKLKDITDLPNGVAVTRTEHADDSVAVTFAPDQHRATFSRSWLAAHADQMTGIDAIAELFAGPGARDYLGEAVTIGEHMRQAGTLAEAAGAPAPLVAAALLHDVGHLLGEKNRGGLGGASPRASTDARHGTGGARWLAQWFGAAVTEPVRLHVAAKRSLCATEPGYFALLSPESVRTLALQGGPMTAEQAAAFKALPYARDAVTVRRWDDEAKDPAITPPEFAYFAPLLESVAGR